MIWFLHSELDRRNCPWINSLSFPPTQPIMTSHMMTAQRTCIVDVILEKSTLLWYAFMLSSLLDLLYLLHEQSVHLLKRSCSENVAHARCQFMDNHTKYMQVNPMPCPTLCFKDTPRARNKWRRQGKKGRSGRDPQNTSEPQIQPRVRAATPRPRWSTLISKPLSTRRQLCARCHLGNCPISSCACEYEEGTLNLLVALRHTVSSVCQVGWKWHGQLKGKHF